jgi:hypothetical protein
MSTTTPEQERMAAAVGELAKIVAQLAAALGQADLYLNSYDMSPPSRVKAHTRLVVEEALALTRAPR